MRQKAFDMLVIGGILQDLIWVLRDIPGKLELDTARQVLSLRVDEKQPAKSLQISLGGGGANAAVALARLGYRVGIVGAVGKEAIGTDLVSALAKENVDTSLISTMSLERSGMSVVLLHESTGEQTSVYSGGANRLVEVTEDVQKILHSSSWVFVSSLGDAWEDNMRALLETLAREQTRLAVHLAGSDLARGAKAYTPLLKAADVLVIGEDEAKQFLEDEETELDVALKSKGPKCVVLTRGGKGASVLTDDARYSIGASSVSVVNTLGAGDAFAATFIASLLKNPADIALALKEATVHAGSVVSTRTTLEGLLSQTALTSRLSATSLRVHRETISL